MKGGNTMFFLIQIKIKTDGTIEKGTANFDTMHDAVVQFHIAMSSAMVKDDVQKFTALIVNENGIPMKTEVYEMPSIPAEIEE